MSNQNSRQPVEETIGRVDSPGESTVPYQPRVFRDFIALIGRLFYDDGCIILLDFLAREQRAFTDAELRDRLRWREPLLQQKLHNLEKQLLIERVYQTEKGSKTVQLWRLQSHVFVSVEWRLKAMEQKVLNELKKASRQSDFQCSNPSCAIKVSLLDAAAGPRALEDDHPLCRNCGSHLTTADAEEARSLAENKLKRVNEQMARLREALARVRGMLIPSFASTQLADSSTDINNDTNYAETNNVPSPASSTVEAPNQGVTSGSKVIPWFNGAYKEPSAQVSPKSGVGMSASSGNAQVQSNGVGRGMSLDVPGSRLMFGTGGQSGGAVGSVNLRIGLNKCNNEGTMATSSSSSSSTIRSPLKLSFGSGTKPFSLSLKSKGSEVGSGVSSVASDNGVNANKKRPSDVFASLSKRVKF